MADTTVTIRVDEDIKRRFEKFCGEVGLNMSVAVNMFIRASLRSQSIPFSIESTRIINGLELIRDMRSEAESRGFLSDEEIEIEIQSARQDIKARRVANV
jgi:DNA-damage-inducible protein J